MACGMSNSHGRRNRTVYRGFLQGGAARTSAEARAFPAGTIIGSPGTPEPQDRTACDPSWKLLAAWRPPPSGVGRKSRHEPRTVRSGARVASGESSGNLAAPHTRQQVPPLACREVQDRAAAVLGVAHHRPTRQRRHLDTVFAGSGVRTRTPGEFLAAGIHRPSYSFSLSRSSDMYATDSSGVCAAVATWLNVRV